MKNKLLTFGGALALIAVLGHFYAKPLMAQVRAALVQDVDQPARAPFQASVSLSYPSTGSVGVSIPAGKRLVIEYVSATMDGASAGGPIQPILLLGTAAGSNPYVNYYFRPEQSRTVSDQFFRAETTRIYGDNQVLVSLGFSGYTPVYMGANVQISGYLITP